MTKSSSKRIIGFAVTLLLFSAVKADDANDDKCSICLDTQDELGEGVQLRTRHCNQKICDPCWAEWVRLNGTICTICKQPTEPGAQVRRVFGAEAQNVYRRPFEAPVRQPFRAQAHAIPAQSRIYRYGPPQQLPYYVPAVSVPLGTLAFRNEYERTMAETRETFQQFKANEKAEYDRRLNEIRGNSRMLEENEDSYYERSLTRIRQKCATLKANEEARYKRNMDDIEKTFQELKTEETARYERKMGQLGYGCRERNEEIKRYCAEIAKYEHSRGEARRKEIRRHCDKMSKYDRVRGRKAKAEIHRHCALKSEYDQNRGRNMKAEITRHCNQMSEYDGVREKIQKETISKYYGTGQSDPPQAQVSESVAPRQSVSYSYDEPIERFYSENPRPRRQRRSFWGRIRGWITGRA